MTMPTLRDNLQGLNERIEKLAKHYRQNPHEVCLVAVSKTRGSEEIRQLAACGHTHFGENYLQEGLDKIAKITDFAIIWHFIGPVQKNKTKAIAEHFDWVHSIDREIIAARLSRQRPESLPPLNVCIQININEESSKAGILPADVPDLASSINTLPRLKLRGLMAIPLPRQDFQQQCATFKKMSALFEQLKANGFNIDTLSMGMSDDYEAAIACGATIVRIGSALFGPRHYS